MQRVLGIVCPILLVGCINIPPLEYCTSRTDCARDEKCGDDGRCVPGASTYREPSNSLVTPPADSGVMSPADSGSAMVDSGPMTSDAGFPQMDAGPVCLNVSIEGRTETFCTIAEAIDSAVANDKIILPAVEIAESIALVDKRVTISGSTQGATKTKIVPPNGQIAIQSAASGAVFEHLEVVAEGAEGIRVANDTILRAIKLSAARGAGIVVTGNASVIIESPEISGVISDAMNVEFGSGAGVRALPGTTVSIADGTISGCQGSGVFSESAILTLTRMTLQQNNYGLEARNLGLGMSILTLNNSNALENNRSGFYVWDSRAIINNCTATSNGTSNVSSDAHGFYFGPGTSPSLQGNSAQMNIGYGMFCGPDVIPTRCESNRFGSNGTATNCAGCR